MTSADTMQFPNIGLRVVSALVHFLGTAILTGCLTRRVALEDLDTLRGWRALSVARLTIILIFADSLAFLLLTGVLVHGIGLELSNASCSLAILSCIALYASSKVIIYFFLSERVWIVWSNIGGTKSEALATIGVIGTKPVAPSIMSARPPTMTQRLKSRVYRFCFLNVGAYVACFVLLLMYRIAHRRGGDGNCVIGLERRASLTLLSYDVYITCFLTGLFVWPLWSNKVMSHRLRRLAIRTLVASFVALVTSTVNVVILTIQHGHELGWLCLVSCGADVMINALVLDFVTESRLKRYIRHSRTRFLVAQGGDLSTSADPSSDARRSQQAHPNGFNTSTLDIGNAVTHSVELPTEANPASFGTLAPLVGMTGAGRIAGSPSTQEFGTREVGDTIQHGRLSPHDEPGEGMPEHSASAHITHSVAPVYSTIAYPPLPPTQLHHRPSGKALTVHVDHLQHRGYPDCESDYEDDDQGGQRGGHDACNCCSEGSSEDDLGDDDDIRRTNRTHRLLSFTEALQELGSLQPPPPSPRVRTTAREAIKAPRRLRWTPRWRQHQVQHLSYLEPMQGPPGAGYIGTSRRMSMPLAPDDIVFDDFYTSTPTSPSSPAWGTDASPMSGLYGSGGNEKSTQDPGSTFLGLPSTLTSPLWTPKHKGVARKGSLEPIVYKSQSGARPFFGAVAKGRNGGLNSPILGESSRTRELQEPFAKLDTAPLQSLHPECSAEEC